MWGDPDADYEKVGALQAELEDKIAAADAWNLDRNVEIAMDALRCPPNDADVTTLSGGERRRVALCRLLLLATRTCCCWTSRPTTSTPRASTGWSGSCRSTTARSSPSPTTATSSTTSPAGSWSSTGDGDFLSKATTRPGWSRSRLAWPGTRSRPRPRQRTLERELEWVRMAPKARQAKGRARLSAYEKLQQEAEAADRGPDRLEISIPPGPRLGDTVIEVEDLAQGLRRPVADRGPLVLAPPRRHRRRHRPQRRGQDDACSAC